MKETGTKIDLYKATIKKDSKSSDTIEVELRNKTLSEIEFIIKSVKENPIL